MSDALDALDALADRLRERLLHAAAADPDGAVEADLAAQIGAVVDREAAMLGPDARAELARRLAQRSFGLGPLEPLLADPEVDEVVVNGAGAGGGGSSRAASGSPRRPSCGMRSSGSWRRSAGGSTSPSRCATRGWATARG
jgi:hypothetical protein